ncbi:hypothetical protein PFICI_02969 [Pestalotiopsis fici W106-1]|uniref:L-tryptophan decarboxylase PsiD-like domain-containing protein n=1 Tax=Pestalotiopsis fici (strain W106-1 / CGMCC3.15140) TaxID=1229662 RepID=W3XG07_PESFW|nr:uncharacterized protein PFICI_02969 [Pestalotiopsis fici W106-1]ETS84944.1 hypothetical protein PFICI_02969 [Pestalotiopsis fici W106-1]
MSKLQLLLTDPFTVQIVIAKYLLPWTNTSLSTTLNDDPTSNNGQTLAQSVAAGAPPPAQPPIETTGRGLLTLENAGALQMGFWVPNRVYAHVKFLAPLRTQVSKLYESKQLKDLHPVVADFKEWVTSHSVYRMWVRAMVEQANTFIATLDRVTKDQIKKDGDTLWISNYDEIFNIMNAIIQTSPAFNNTVQVGCPMSGFLAVGMGTQAGVALFHDATFNGQFQKVLNAWNAFLKSPKSLDKLDITNPEKPGSWISKEAFKAGVWDDIQYDPTQPGYGFDSWNSFFTRPFAPGVRSFDGNGTNVVNVGCETTPWAYVQSADQECNFWIKDGQYSLIDLFASKSDIASLFVGGPVYQGFLSAVHYHRWHCPIDGQLVLSWVEPGTYFAQRPNQGQNPGLWEGMGSQTYIPHVATRAIFIFKHPKCGHVAMVCIGMVEVSTCIIEKDWIVKPGDDPKPISRGTEIGHFEFGGSTHMLLFEKDKVTLEDWAKGPPSVDVVRMGSVIASALGSN